MENIETLKRGDKIYLDKEEKEESEVNHYLECRDGIVEVYEYREPGPFGNDVRLFLCEDSKHEHISIVRQTYDSERERWREDSMSFDTDSFKYLVGLITGNQKVDYGKHTLIRDYSDNYFFINNGKE